MATLELISHPICPFVHRASAFLTERRIPFTQWHVDLQAKPDWFLALSPRGKVPVLVVDGAPIFESAVILAYLAETYAPDLIPTDALGRARERMWIEISNDLMTAQYKIAVAPTPIERAAGIASARDTLARFEQVIAGPFFAGDAPNLVDFAAGPALVRFDRLAALLGVDFYAQLPKVAAWARAIAARPSFTATLVADFRARFDQIVRRHDEAA